MMVPVKYRDVELNRYYVTDNAIIYEKINEDFINLKDSIRINKSDGYWQVTLCNIQGVRKTYPLYRIVIGSFLGDRPDMVVDHVDMNRNHNQLSNLEYVTYDENLRRAARVYGKAYRELFTEDQVRQICELLEKGYNSRKIQKTLGLLSSDKRKQAAMDDSLMRIIYRVSWKHISKDYTWNVDDVRLKVYAKEDLRLIAYMVIHSGYGPKEIAERFPKYNLKQLNAVVKKMNQGKLYKKFLEEAGSTTIAEDMEPLRDSDGFMRLMPTALGVKRLRKIRQDISQS